MRNSVTKEQFVQKVVAARQPPGKVLSRVLKIARTMTSLLSAPDVSTARSVTTKRPRVRKREISVQCRAKVPHVTMETPNLRVYENTRALLSRSMIVFRPARSSQTRKRA